MVVTPGSKAIERECSLILCSWQVCSGAKILHVKNNTQITAAINLKFHGANLVAKSLLQLQGCGKWIIGLARHDRTPCYQCISWIFIEMDTGHRICFRPSNAAGFWCIWDPNLAHYGEKAVDNDLTWWVNFQTLLKFTVWVLLGTFLDYSADD